MAIEQKFLIEALALLDDDDVKLGMLAKYRLRAYAEEYSKKIKEDPARAKKVLEKIQQAIEKVLT